MKVSDLMTKPAASCRPETNLAAAGALMWENDCGVLPVLNDRQQVIGVITDRDICIALATRNGRASEITVADVCTHEPALCSSKDDVQAALRTMQARKIRRLPVVDAAGGLEGIVSMNDIVLHAENAAAGKQPDLPWSGALQTFQAICTHTARAKSASAAA